MARRKAANPAWKDKAAIGHCVRSFRNDVAVWCEEAIPSDNSPKMLKVIRRAGKSLKSYSAGHGKLKPR
jgi:hypothetical protein